MTDNVGNIWINVFFVIVAINVLSFIADYFLESIPALQARFFKLSRPAQQSAVVLISGPPLILPLIPQPHFTFLGSITKPLGIIIFIGACIVEVLAFAKIGFIPSLIPEDGKKEVIDTGVYGYVRHPIYSGVIFMSLGLSLYFSSIHALAYLPVAVALFSILTVVEEKGLVTDYGDAYIRYRNKNMWRLIPYVI